jgi:hypothetical protein
MDQVIYRCKTKATDREGDLIRPSLNWAFARRGELRLTDRAIECGDWTIPYEEVDDAVLLAIPTRFGIAYNLKIKSQGRTYQFQVSSNSGLRTIVDPFWFGETPLPLRKEAAHIDSGVYELLMPRVNWIYLATFVAFLLVASLFRLLGASK